MDSHDIKQIVDDLNQKIASFHKHRYEDVEFSPKLEVADDSVYLARYKLLDNKEDDISEHEIASALISFTSDTLESIVASISNYQTKETLKQQVKFWLKDLEFIRRDRSGPRMNWELAETEVTEKDIEHRINLLTLKVEVILQEFVRACQECKKKGACIALHQDAFAGDYQEEEYTLLGMFVKYAGLVGIDVRIMGKNRETYKSKSPV